MEDCARAFQVGFVHVVDQYQWDAMLLAVDGRGDVVDDGDQTGDVGLNDLAQFDACGRFQFHL